jgi:hypothetical protein
MTLQAIFASSVLAAALATDPPLTVTCVVPNDPAARVFRLRQGDDGWLLGVRHKELGAGWLELKLPGAEPVFTTRSARLKYRNANGGRQVDLTVGPDGSSLDVWVDHGLEVNIEPDLNPRVDLMNTDGPLRTVSCRLEH